MKITNGAGNINVRLGHKAGEYDVFASGSTGRIEIFDESRIGADVELLKRGDGLRHLNIENGIGVITVRQ